MTDTERAIIAAAQKLTRAYRMGSDLECDQGIDEVLAACDAYNLESKSC